MKKILSILMILVLVGGVAFAQLTPEVTASASVNWGIDLGKGNDGTVKHGFENFFDAKIVVPLYMDKLSRKTEGDVHMEFDMDLNLAYRHKASKSNSDSPYEPWDSDKEFSLWRKTLSGMSASIHFFGGYMNVFGRPNFSTEFATIWGPLRDRGDAERPETKGDITGFGTKLGYKNDDIAGTGLKLDAGLKFASNGSWDGTKQSSNYEVVDLAVGDPVDPNAAYYLATGELDSNGKPIFTGAATNFTGANNTVGGGQDGKYLKKTNANNSKLSDKYALGFDLSVGYDKWVTLDFGINATLAPVKDYVIAEASAYDPLNPDKNYLAMGFKLGSKAVEGLDVSLGVDTLMNIGPENKVAADMLFDVAYKWVKAGLYYGNKYSGYTTMDKDLNVVGNMAMRLAFISKDSGDTNLLPGLGFGLDLRFYNMLGYLSDTLKEEGYIVPMGFKLWADYKIMFNDSMWLKPYTNFWVESNNMARADGSTDGKKYYLGVAYNIGATFSPMEKVEIDAKWSHGKVGWNDYEGSGMISAPANYKNHNGRFVFGVTVKY